MDSKAFSGAPERNTALRNAAGHFAGALKAMRDESGIGSLDDFFKRASEGRKNMLKDGESSQSRAESSTSSMTSEIIKNGKRVKMTKTCKNGICKETTEN